METADFDTQAWHAPYRAQLPTTQQVAAAIAILSLVGPTALGGIPVIPIGIEDQRRRHQDEIQQVSESSVGVYQTSQEAEAGLSLSQQRLASVTREIGGITVHDVSEEDIVRAADRVLTGQVEPKLDGRFRSALNHVAWDTVDLFILRDGEEFERTQQPPVL